MASNPEFFTYKDVTIYHERRDNHEQSVPMNFWYSTSPAVQHEAFDVRDIPNPGVVAESREDRHKQLIKHAIDEGMLPQ